MMVRPERITREKVIRAVLDSAFTKNAESITVGDIAERLGKKKNSIYTHYSSRDLIIADTLRYCQLYLQHLSLVPQDLARVAAEQPAEVVLKSMVEQWFKKNESDPLLQIHSFIESEKYFSSAAMHIVTEFRARIAVQIQSVLSSLSEAEKIRSLKPVELKDYALIFASMLCELVDMHVVRRKEEIRVNPEMGVDSLFGALPFEDVHVQEANRLVSRFVALLSS